MNEPSRTLKGLSRLSLPEGRVIIAKVGAEERTLREGEWGRECVDRAEEIGIDLGLLA